MLPKELLEVTRRKGKIYPKFAWIDEVKLADRIIKLYRAGVEKRYGTVLKALRKLEDARNYRKVRGFAKIIERECEFESVTALDPVEVRRELFSKGYVTSLKEREKVLKEVAEKFNVDVEEIERAMFADREEEKVLVRIPDITPEELVKRYNLSLLQTAIFNCLRLTFWVSSNHKLIFRKLKWLGLMYELYEEDESGRLMTDVTGPASILKMTRKYGTSMAKLIPEIVRAEKWWLRAEVVDDYDKKIYFLELSDAYKKLFPDSVKEEGETYDSSLEETFARKMRYLGFEVVREPGVVKAGNYAYIPDFLVRKGEKEVYIEIAGFWTEDYLKKKLEKIKKSNIPLILLVREDLALGSCKIRKGVDVVLIDKRGRIPYGEVLRKIEEHI